MNKLHKIIYWVATLWLALGMASTGVVQLLQLKEEIEFVINLGYPAYFLTIIGIWKLVGVLVILLPRLPLIKEWAYAGFFFVASGAVISQLATGHTGIGDWFPGLLLLVLTVLSWYYRPAGRRLNKI